MRLLGGLFVIACLAACGSPGTGGTGGSGGSAETDRIAETVAIAVASPRQITADGYLRAILSTAAAEDGRLTVVTAERVGGGLPQKDLLDPYARFTWLVRVDGSESGFSSQSSARACYDVAFNYYGAVETPGRSDCPVTQAAVTAIPGPEPSHAPLNPTAGG